MRRNNSKHAKPTEDIALISYLFKQKSSTTQKQSKSRSSSDNANEEPVQPQPLSEIITQNSNDLFMYYLIESVEECVDKNNSSKLKSIVLSFPRLYLNTNKREFEYKSYDDIVEDISTNDILIEKYDSEKDDSAIYALITISDFENDFFHVEKIKPVLTLDDMNFLEQGKSKQHGGVSDILYKSSALDNIINDPNNPPDVSDGIPYRLFEKLNIENAFNYFTAKDKDVNGPAINVNLTIKTNPATNANTYRSILHYMFTKSYMLTNSNSSTYVYGYIKKYTDYKTHNYFLHLANKIKDELLGTRDILEYIIPDNIIEIDKPNITIARILGIWFLVEKWIDVFITHKFNIAHFTMNKFWIKNKKLHINANNTANIENINVVYNNWETITTRTYEFHVSSLKSQLTKLGIVNSKNTNGKSNTDDPITASMERIYGELSYHKILTKLLKQFLVNMTYMIYDKYESQHSVLLDRQKKLTAHDDKRKIIAIEIKHLDDINKNLNSDNDKKNKINKYETYIKKVLLRDFSVQLTEYLKLNNTNIRNAEKLQTLTEMVVEYIFNSVSKHRTKPGIDIWTSFKYSFQDKADNSIFRHTRDLILYLLAKTLSEQIELTEVKPAEVQKKSNHNTRPSSSSSPDLGFEITGMSDDDDKHDLGIDSNVLDIDSKDNGNDNGIASNTVIDDKKWGTKRAVSIKNTKSREPEVIKRPGSN